MKRVIPALILFLVLAMAYVLWLKRGTGGSGNNGRPPDAYVYDIEKYRATPNADLLFDELAGFEVALKEPRGIAAGPDKGLFVVGDAELVRLDGEGREAERIALKGAANCVTSDGAGKVYAGLADHIAVWSPGTTNVVHWGSLGENALLTSISADAGNVFAADFGNRVIWRCDTQGRLLGAIGGKDAASGSSGFILPSPYFDLAIRDDRLWVVNPGRTRVEEYTFEGRMLSHWGRSSMRPEGFCGCCNPSHIALFPDGRFVTSEKGLPRVKVYDAKGVFVGLVAGPDMFAEDAVGLDLAVDSRGRILVLDPARRMVRVFAAKG